jgi:hypothetical protein
MRNVREFCLQGISFVLVGFFKHAVILTAWERRRYLPSDGSRATDVPRR